jgi:transposase
MSDRFRDADYRDCPVRSKCTRAANQGRFLKVPVRAHYEALREMRSFLASEAGRRLYAKRAGVEGTISQGVRSFGLRRARYRGPGKAHLQHVATATAINFSRVSDWLSGVPRAATRTSRFARRAA